MNIAKKLLVTGIASMMLFSTDAYGITYNESSNRLNQSYMITKNGDVSSFMAIGSTGYYFCTTNSYFKKK